MSSGSAERRQAALLTHHPALHHASTRAVSSVLPKERLSVRPSALRAPAAVAQPVAVALRAVATTAFEASCVTTIQLLVSSRHTPVRLQALAIPPRGSSLASEAAAAAAVVPRRRRRGATARRGAIAGGGRGGLPLEFRQSGVVLDEGLKLPSDPCHGDGLS
jgi:hypothetical protein